MAKEVTQQYIIDLIMAHVDDHSVDFADHMDLFPMTVEATVQNINNTGDYYAQISAHDIKCSNCARTDGYFVVVRNSTKMKHRYTVVCEGCWAQVKEQVHVLHTDQAFLNKVRYAAFMLYFRQAYKHHGRMLLDSYEYLVLWVDEILRSGHKVFLCGRDMDVFHHLLIKAWGYAPNQVVYLEGWSRKFYDYGKDSQKEATCKAYDIQDGDGVIDSGFSGHIPNDIKRFRNIRATLLTKDSNSEYPPFGWIEAFRYTSDGHGPNVPDYVKHYREWVTDVVEHTIHRGHSVTPQAPDSISCEEWDEFDAISDHRYWGKLRAFEYALMRAQKHDRREARKRAKNWVYKKEVPQEELPVAKSTTNNWGNCSFDGNSEHAINFTMQWGTSASTLPTKKPAAPDIHDCTTCKCVDCERVDTGDCSCLKKVHGDNLNHMDCIYYCYNCLAYSKKQLIPTINVPVKPVQLSGPIHDKCDQCSCSTCTHNYDDSCGKCDPVNHTTLDAHSNTVECNWPHEHGCASKVSTPVMYSTTPPPAPVDIYAPIHEECLKCQCHNCSELHSGNCGICDPSSHLEYPEDGIECKGVHTMCPNHQPVCLIFKSPPEEVFEKKHGCFTCICHECKHKGQHNEDYSCTCYCNKDDKDTHTSDVCEFHIGGKCDSFEKEDKAKVDNYGKLDGCKSCLCYTCDANCPEETATCLDCDDNIEHCQHYQASLLTFKFPTFSDEGIDF